MKIYFIGDYMDSFKKDAPVLVATGLFESLLRKNVPVKYLTYFREGSKYSRYQKLFGKQILNTVSIRFGIFPLLLYIIRTRPDVLYLLNMEFFYLPLLLLKFVLRYKIFYTTHGIVSYENRYFRSMPYFLAKKTSLIEHLNFMIADNIISLSEKTARLITYCYQINPAKIKVFSNGITPQEMMGGNAMVFNLSNIKIATVGSSTRKEKGADFLIKALSASDYNVELNIFGEQSDLFRSDKYNNVTVNLHPFSEKKEMLHYLSENDILIAPSSYDTFNVSLLEAMNIGMLFISSDRVGLTERFDDRLKKFVYKHYSSADLLDKLNMVIKLSPEERKYYSDLNHEFSLGFTWDKVSTQYLELFNG
jgi:glycosyltransferase involved in cell wall biosynthesis